MKASRSLTLYDPTSVPSGVLLFCRCASDAAANSCRRATSRPAASSGSRGLQVDGAAEAALGDRGVGVLEDVDAADLFARDGLERPYCALPPAPPPEASPET